MTSASRRAAVTLELPVSVAQRKEIGPRAAWENLGANSCLSSSETGNTSWKLHSVALVWTVP